MRTTRLTGSWLCENMELIADGQEPTAKDAATGFQLESESGKVGPLKKLLKSS
jgi:hypothetical protein